MTSNPRMVAERIGLKHGAGGGAMRSLVQEIFSAGLAPTTDGSIGLDAMDDGAAIKTGDQWLVITTDSHVIQPLRFPGGDIGRLSICGTVNDLAMMGATEPLALTCSVIVEEGFARCDLERIWVSVRTACDQAQTTIVTGDTKVMGHGEIDGLVINTTGVAMASRVVTDCGLAAGDRIIVSGTMGDHGLAVMATRNELALETELVSDVAPINGMVRRALAVGGSEIVALKDPTRGGLSSALHEMAEKSGVGIVIDESAVPIRESVRSVGELLGIDPLVVANEGKAAIGVRPEMAEAVLDTLRAHPLGRDAAIIGTCSKERVGTVILDTGLGRRLLAEAEGELLPRIC